ncbi:cupin domain-containing protein [Mesobacillus sp. AQ2]|uniref:cupin domain-containing protein n=1 Tax=Mesobacillus sp. AQ2 TaxID=3043332 RepID=UPI0024C144FF|nr:cupin domain-containing protein [Mesobacillus sp. AQ2]WHX43031.1 cupin domain-containing protein [Mesobacillus sp. AQ2]
MKKVNISEKFSLFNDYWSPKIAGEINDMHVKFAKLKGEFIWHMHEHEDEMFLVMKGKLLLKFRYKDVHLNEGEFIIVPKGVEHLPIAEEEADVIFFEPKSTLNTGNEQNDRTVSDLQSI